MLLYLKTIETFIFIVSFYSSYCVLLFFSVFVFFFFIWYFFSLLFFVSYHRFADSSRSHASFCCVIVWCAILWIFAHIKWTWTGHGHGGGHWQINIHTHIHIHTCSDHTLKFRRETYASTAQNVIRPEIVGKMRNTRGAVGTLCALIFVNLGGIG